MRILYVYPHPDDESFGPAAVMFDQQRAGHEVHLLTLTKGGATKVRHKLGLTVDEMGDVRRKEMSCVRERLDLSGMTVLDLPDSGLKDLDPRIIEAEVEAEIERVRPNVVVTYAVMGVSGFADHVVTHAVVKRVFVALREKLSELQRLAMFALTEDDVAQSKGPIRLYASSDKDIDCIVNVSRAAAEANLDTLRCYASYAEVIERSGVMENRGSSYHFELFDEDHDPPLGDLFAGLLSSSGS